MMVLDVAEPVPVSRVQDEYEPEYRLSHLCYCEFYNDNLMEAAAVAMMELLHQQDRQCFPVLHFYLHLLRAMLWMMGYFQLFPF